jgi:CRISPR/Cas system Type II protein with McrA/HNH and RuvC-like nuclease domain
MSNRKTDKAYYALRWEVLKRDNFTCQYCGQHAPNVKLEVDHIIPFREGGDDSMGNLLTSCYSCNRGKNASSIISRPFIKPFIKENSLSSRILKIITSDGNKKTKELAEILVTNEATIRTITNRLKNRGFIQRDGEYWSKTKQ